MAIVTRSELLQQPARVLARVEAGEVLTIIDHGRPIARFTPVSPDRRAQRLATGALRTATETGAPSISTPLRDWSTAQMLEDMCGTRL